ncbi:hypothetical protein J4217_04240 [Candidatus Pacearchaeota archaeon]|nr:hypothetical protein [Candidatus Pacearchaeota archaeon]
MTKCVFCGREEPDYTGVHLIKNDGTVDFYCSSKCRKNSLKLGRDKRKLKWTLTYKDSLKSNAAREIAHEAKKVEDAKEAKKVADEKAIVRKAFKEARTDKKAKEAKK